MTSTSEMNLIGSVNHGYGTDIHLHYTLNDIMLHMTWVYIFTFEVQWRLVLLWKCWAFCVLYWDLSMNYWTYWNLWFMWVFPEWQMNWNEVMYNTGNKFLKCKWILSYHFLVQELSRETQKTHCDIISLKLVTSKELRSCTKKLYHKCTLNSSS